MQPDTKYDISPLEELRSIDSDGSVERLSSSETQFFAKISECLSDSASLTDKITTFDNYYDFVIFDSTPVESLFDQNCQTTQKTANCFDDELGISINSDLRNAQTLTPEGEIYYAKQLWFSRLANQILSDPEHAGNVKNDTLFVAIERGEIARKAMFEGNLYWVYEVVMNGRAIAPHLPLSDRLQIGVMKLVELIDKYDPRRGTMKGFTKRSVLSSIKTYISNHAEDIKISAETYRTVIRPVKDFLAGEYYGGDGNATRFIGDIVKHTGLSKVQVERALQYISRTQEIDGELMVEEFGEKPEEKSIEEILFVGGELRPTEVQAQLGIRNELLWNLVIKVLANNPRWIEVLEKRYIDGYTQEQVAKEYGVTDNNISRIEREALKRVRDYFNAIGVEETFEI